MATGKTAAPTPTAESGWETYRNSDYGFAFEYPTAYETPENRAQCGLWVEDQADGIIVHWGMRSSLSVFPSLGKSADDTIRTRVGQDASQLALTEFTAGGVSGSKATYRFGGTARFGIIYAVVIEARAFAASYTAGPACEPEGFPMLEPALLDHVMESLEVNP